MDTSFLHRVVGIRAHLAAIAVVLGLCHLDGTASAQTTPCTLSQPVTGPDRQILTCTDGLRIEAEAGAQYRLFDRDGNGTVDRVSHSGGALLIEVDGARRRGGFQIRTPHAIAAVRGTTWAVDVGASRTSVFVVDGRVAVNRLNSRRGVLLGPGEGVDVQPGAAPLEVKRWPPARVSALLARFGR